VGAVKVSRFNQLAMANERTCELEWKPDTDLLMSKLRDVEEDRSADTFLGKLVSVLQLQCCCLESVGQPEMVKRMQPDLTTFESVPQHIYVATAPDQSDDEDDLNTVTLEYPPMTKDDVGMADTLPEPRQPPPPNVYTENQTPCNSPRGSNRKQNGPDSEEEEEEEAKKSKPKPRIQQFGWRNPLKRRSGVKT
jgi:hypothetical protein